MERGEQLGTPETADFMDAMSDEARKVTCRINATYHSREELVELLSELTGKRVDPSVKLFRPFTRISARTSRWARTCSSMIAAISKTMAE